MEQGIQAWQATGAANAEPYFLQLLAAGHAQAGRTTEALAVVAKALARIEQTEERCWEAELCRLQGELTLRQFQEREAEACFLKAVAVAREQHAKSLELRASMSLARLWQSQGKRDEARELLEEIYHWFTEGFDTKDLQEAEALLVTLGGRVKTQDEKRMHGRMGERTNGRVEKAEIIAPLPRHPVTPAFSPSPPPIPNTRHQTPTPHATGPATSDAGLRTPDAVFRNEGDYWTVTFGGTTCRIRDTLGMRYLAQLLTHPHEEVHVLTLAAEDTPHTESSPMAGSDADAMQAGFSDAGEFLDPQARVAYRQRLRDLQEELEEARSFHDEGRIEKLHEEIEFLTHELTQAVGLGGRSRKAASVAERARVNVTKRIKIALRKISEQHPTLGEHLTQAIRTGTFCEYVPLPHQPVTWED